MSSPMSLMTDRQLRRNRLYTTSGVVIEWYDFMIYGLMATTLQVVFYPTENSSVGLIMTFATFAVGYLARPIGGMVIGRLGDTRGRRFALVLATTLMLIPLFVITFLPGYEVIGLWAPVILTLMRLLQGFSVGGEYTGALTALSETGDASRRGRSVSLGLVTAMGGNLLASLVVFVVTVTWGSEALAEGTWRIPYAIGLVMACISVILQRRMHETHSFQAAKGVGATGSPLRQLLRRYPVASLLMLALATWSGVTEYTLISWMPTYLETVIGFSNAQADGISAFLSLVYMLVVMPIAFLGDRVGRRRLMYGIVVAYIVLSIPAFLAFEWGAIVGILLAIGTLAVMQAFVDSTTTTEMTELVPTRVRYTGLAITYSIGMIIGSFTPAFEQTLTTITGNPLIPAYVVMAISVVLLPVIALLPRYLARARAAESAPEARRELSLS